MKVKYVLIAASLAMAAVYLLPSAVRKSLRGLKRLSSYLLLLFISLMFGAISSLDQDFSLVNGEVLGYWLGLIVFIGLGGLAAIVGQYTLILWALVLAGIPILAAALEHWYPFLSVLVPGEALEPISRDQRATGLFLNPNNTGFAIFTALVASLTLHRLLHNRLIRYGLLSLAAIYSYGIYMTLSRSSLVVTLLFALTFLYLNWRRSRFRWIVLGVGLMAFVILSTDIGNFSETSGWAESRVFHQDAFEENVFRVEGIYTALKRMPNYLFLGEGFGGFRDVSYDFIGLLDKSPHNQILAILVEWGLLALIFMYMGHLMVFWTGLQNFLRGCPDHVSHLLCAYVCIILFLQSHGIFSPSSCALLGLGAGAVFQTGKQARFLGVGGGTNN